MKAQISQCGTYRYKLYRHGDLAAEKPAAVFVMLNPSTADADLDDPTIRRCRGFAKLWGCNGIIVVNLYALRATNPADLWNHVDPVGPENDAVLRSVASGNVDIICAWGANARRDRVIDVIEILARNGNRLWCLGTTKDGHPRHPLYVRADQPLAPWGCTP